MPFRCGVVNTRTLRSVAPKQQQHGQDLWRRCERMHEGCAIIGMEGREVDGGLLSRPSIPANCRPKHSRRPACWWWCVLHRCRTPVQGPALQKQSGSQAQKETRSRVVKAKACLWPAWSKDTGCPDLMLAQIGRPCSPSCLQALARLLTCIQSCIPYALKHVDRAVDKSICSSGGVWLWRVLRHGGQGP